MADGAAERSIAAVQRYIGKDEEEHGKAGNEYAAVFNNLALIYEISGTIAEAKPLYEAAVDPPPCVKDHPNTASSLNNLANLYRTRGRYSKAEPLYAKALSTRRREFGTVVLIRRIALITLRIVSGSWAICRGRVALEGSGGDYGECWAWSIRRRKL